MVLYLHMPFSFPSLHTILLNVTLTEPPACVCVLQDVMRRMVEKQMWLLFSVNLAGTEGLRQGLECPSYKVGGERAVRSCTASLPQFAHL
jgi:hypothetical protein